MIHYVQVEKLANYPDFHPDSIGAKFGVSFNIFSVLTAKPVDYCIDDQRKVEYHLGRVKYLMENGWDDDPIEIDCYCNSGSIYPEPILLDGNHRFLAALFGRKITIACIFSGRIDLLEYLIKPTSLEGSLTNSPHKRIRKCPKVS